MNLYNFDPELTAQISNKGIELEVIENQIENFKNGFPYLNLKKPAVAGKGILKLSESKIDDFINKYDYVSKKNTYCDSLGQHRCGKI